MKAAVITAPGGPEVLRLLDRPDPEPRAGEIRVRARFAGVNFADIAARLGAAHLVIGRAGASTVCELAVAGRPAILVPLKIALDDDQGQNARLLVEAGAAVMLREDDLSVDSLADLIQSLIGDPARLATMAQAAKSVARPDAADRLADLVEATANG